MARPRKIIRPVKPLDGPPTDVPYLASDHMHKTVDAFDEDIMSLRDVQKELEQEEAQFSSLEEVETELSLEEFDGLEVETEPEFEVYPEMHTSRGYDKLIMRDRPVRMQAFNASGKEVVGYEAPEEREIEYVEIPVKQSVLDACNRSEHARAVATGGQTPEQLHAEVRAIKAQMLEDKRANEGRLAAEAVKKASTEAKRRMAAQRLGRIG